MTHEKTRHLLRRQGLAPQKKLGQNFLVHAHTAQRIVDLAHLEATDQVVEVGVGLGALTRPLAAAASKVIGIEADSGIIRMHQDQQDLPDNVQLLHADVLKVDFKDLTEPGRRLKIVANLPYSISTPFLFRLLEHADLMDMAVVMLQKEVAQRLLAPPGNKEYGAPTVLLAACANITPLFLVKPAEFHPRPKIDSQVVRISFHPQPERVRKIGPFDRVFFRRVVHAAFGQRRKTLLNALSAGGFGFDKPTLHSCLVEAAITPSIRAEQLDLEDFVRLSRTLSAAVPTASITITPSL